MSVKVTSKQYNHVRFESGIASAWLFDPRELTLTMPGGRPEYPSPKFDVKHIPDVIAILQAAQKWLEENP